ncbi:MAG: winged helix domain-containing protein, partial [Luteimonas sp.]
VDAMIADADDALRYRDPDLAPPADAHEIDAAAMNRVVEALNMLRMNDPDRLGDWFGRFITLYRVGAEAAPGNEPRSRIEIEWDLQQGGTLHRHPWTRMAWRRAADDSDGAARLYVAGEDHPLPSADASRIAAAPVIDGAMYGALSDHGRDLLMELLGHGHYRLQLPEPEDADEEGP